MSPLDSLWTQLRGVEALQFQSTSRTGTGWSGAGSGSVAVTEVGAETLIYQERGSWKQNEGKEINFRNTYRWTRHDERLRLEHLRFGADNPVFLFELALMPDGNWRDIAPHICRADFYSAALRVEADQIFLSWTVKGRDRDESIDYLYASA